jgi:acyl dehydratase
MQGHQETALGQEFTLHTQFRFRDDIVWTEECTYLARRKGKLDRSKLRELRETRAPEFPQPGTARAERFRVDAALARRYAWNAGDWNPIHLTNMTSRALGFDRAMIHGMWSLARCAGTFSEEALHRRFTFEAYFKAPAFLPVDLVSYTWPTDSGEAFVLRNSDNQKAHLTGALTFSAPR